MKIILLIAIFFVGCISETTKIAESQSVEMGDAVSINYIAKIDGLVFDTSYESVASDAKIPKIEGFKPKASYEPLNFTSGKGLMIPALEKALIGMKVGEKKEISIPPEEAYGDWSPLYVLPAPKFYELTRIGEIPLEEFRQGTGSEPKVDNIVKLRYWSGRILNVSNESVTLLHEPVNGSYVETSMGQAAITMNNTHIRIEVMPVINSTVQTQFGTGRIVGINETSVLVDYNHPLAGKTLIFQVKVEKIIKAGP
ncbi:MAG: FKBP-type peptidyl-prolyl cis-trans isomerase [Euryarchaeota archaeon]|nr:FKBP-type peptidyl-prolyl cis-trans isomerase [Euryarchaeota archaeon]